jgi:hypothetical protein
MFFFLLFVRLSAIVSLLICEELEKRVQNTVGQMTVLNKDLMLEAVAFIKDANNLTAIGMRRIVPFPSR